ncbi:hypothetical protein Ciccas_001532 [Cichlidogyrus casuarinus]|uniref:Uncharacterized protein n=1 Tax=Cichlidogyrus casuarinus TaxID=1844966 RepID=A0ABD2QJQ9_9PLAT
MEVEEECPGAKQIPIGPQAGKVYLNQLRTTTTEKRATIPEPTVIKSVPVGQYQQAGSTLKSNTGVNANANCALM